MSVSYVVGRSLWLAFGVGYIGRYLTSLGLYARNTKEGRIFGFTLSAQGTPDGLKSLGWSLTAQKITKEKCTNEAERLLKTKEINLSQIAIAKRYMKIKGLFL